MSTVKTGLKWLSVLNQTIIYSNSSYNNIEDYMLPGISELQPRRVSWSDNRIYDIASTKFRLVGSFG